MQKENILDENSSNLLDTKETTEIFPHNDGKNYYEEALENHMAQQELDEDSESDKENINEENIPTIENIQQEENEALTSEISEKKPSVMRKKTKKSKTTTSTKGRKNYQFLK